MPTESEIRELVQRVVSELVPDEAKTSEVEPEGAAKEVAVDNARAVAVGADHGGFALKERLAFRLRESGWDVHDCGTDSSESVDYPDFAHAVARLVAEGTCAVGVIVDGAGIGSAMVANKVPGVRAALCYDLSSATNSREHNHANVLTLGAGLTGEALAWQIVEAWLDTPWGSERHARRVAKITEIEGQYVRGGR